jgi:P27 family predicted phage terminase small subunit
MADIHALRGKEQSPAPPRGLVGKARAFWGKVTRDFVLEPFHLDTLEQACWSLQRAEEAREIVNTEGQFYRNEKTGQLARHPALVSEEKARAQFLRCVRELGLDIAADESRPPARTGRRGR